MSYRERLLREYVRSVLREEDTMLKAAEKITDAPSAPGEGGFEYGKGDLPTWIEKHGYNRVDCRGRGPLCGIAWLLGVPKSAQDMVSHVFGRHGLFNIEALWKTNVSFLGEETLKPMWDALADVFSMETMPDRPTFLEDMWASLFPRTSAAAASANAAAPSTAPAVPMDLAARIAASETTVTESVFLIFENGEDLSGGILAAFQSDIDRIRSGLQRIMSQDDVVDAVEEWQDLIGYQLGNTDGLADSLLAAQGLVDHAEMIDLLTSKIIPKMLLPIFNYMRDELAKPFASESFLGGFGPDIRAKMIDILNDAIDNLIEMTT